MFILFNLWRPVMISYLSERSHSEIMASWLSAESQCSTLLLAGYAPLLGIMADS
ncbi:MFS transporter, partial [Methanosarcinales archaeon]